MKIRKHIATLGLLSLLTVAIGNVYGQVHIDSLPLQQMNIYWNEVGLETKKLENNFFVLLSNEPLQTVDFKVRKKRLLLSDSTLILLFYCSDPYGGTWSKSMNQGNAPRILNEKIEGLTERKWYGTAVPTFLKTVHPKKKLEISYITQRKVSIVVLDYKHLLNLGIYREKMECEGLRGVHNVLPSEFGSANPMVFLFEILESEN